VQLPGTANIYPPARLGIDEQESTVIIIDAIDSGWRRLARNDMTSPLTNGKFCSRISDTITLNATTLHGAQPHLVSVERSDSEMKNGRTDFATFGDSTYVCGLELRKVARLGSTTS
jgi:hypothetical protein